MKVFDWEQFWIDHPRKQMMIENNRNWTNLRPNSYDYWDAFAEINKILQVKKTDRVLEVGCGTGEMLGLVSSYLGSVNQLAAVDFSQTMVDIAKDQKPEFLITKAPAHILPFIDDTFDKVYMTGVIQHIAYPLFEQSIFEMLRVTKVGGIVFIGDVLEKADKSAEVFVYPKEIWKQFGPVDFHGASFEGRLNVVITKTQASASTFEIKGQGAWGTGNI